MSENAKTSRPALGPTKPPIQWVRGNVNPGVKRPGHEAYHSPQSGAKVKNGGDKLPLISVQSVVLD
jgi:hypothetical protein